MNSKSSQPKSKKRKYPYNESFFASVDSPNKAYFLGFILADGCITRHNEVLIEINNKDRIILEIFQKYLNLKSPLMERIQNTSYGQAHTCRLSLQGAKIVNDLNSYGITSKKTFTATIPIIPDYLYRHFYRGLLDGDGSISFTKRNCLEANICGNLSVMQGFSDFLTFLGIENKITKDHSIYRVRLCNQRAKKFLDYIYENTTLFLNRKHNNYIKYLNFLNSRPKRAFPKGISPTKNKNFIATSLQSITKNKAKYLGRFDTIEEAQNAQEKFHKLYLR